MLKFKPIEDRLGPIETIESLILHLKLIKSDMVDDVGYDNDTIKASIDRRMFSVNVLNKLLTEYCNQPDIAGN